MPRLSPVALLAAIGLAAFNPPARAEPPPDSPPAAGGVPVAEPGPRREPAGKDGRGEGFGDRDRERFIEKLFEGIALSGGQRDALEKLKEAKQAEMKQFHEEHKAEFEAFRKSMKDWYESNKGRFESIRKAMRTAGETQDKDALKKAQDELKALLGSRPKPADALKAGMPDLAAVAESIRPILTPDQVKTFEENIRKMEEMKKKMEDGGFAGRRGRESDRKDGAPPRRRMQKDAEKKPE